MRNKAIVRIEASNELNELMNTQLVTSIFHYKIAANKYVIKSINPALYLQENFIERIESATKAYELVCKATGLVEEASTASAWNAFYISEMKKIAPLTNTEAYQEKLVEYLQFLVYQFNKIAAEKESNPLLGTKPVHWLNKADQYTTLSDKPALVTITKSGEIIRIQMEIPESPFNDEMLEEILYAHLDNMDSSIRELRLKCPEWYKQMPEYEKALFNQVMQPYTIKTLDISEVEKNLKKNAIKSDLVAISSRLRSIPGVANFSRHECLFLRERDGQYEVVNSSLSYRSSALSPRDQLEFDTHVDNNRQLMLSSAKQQENQILQIFNKNNPEANLATLPILSQTLLSPIRSLDNSLYQNKVDAINEISQHGGVLLEGSEEPIVPQNLMQTNHPLNAARHISETGRKGIITLGSSQRTQDSIQQMLRLANEKLTVWDNKLPQFQELTCLVNELSRRWRSEDNPIDLANNREIHLAALEGLIIQNLGGLDHSTCVSGKDRDGLLHIYKDAIKEYFVLYNDFPPYDMDDLGRSAERKNFVKIFADIFLTNHQQLNAGQNAPGAGGIKTPERYLPEDMLTAIKNLAIEKNRNEPIKESNALANNNDFGKLLKKQPNRIRRHAGWSALAGFCAGIGLSGTSLLITGGILWLLAIGIEVAFPFVIPIGIGIGCIVLLGTALGGGIGYAVKKKSEENKWDAIAAQAPNVENNFDADVQGRYLNQVLGVGQDNLSVVNDIVQEPNRTTVELNPDMVAEENSREQRFENLSNLQII